MNVEPGPTSLRCRSCGTAGAGQSRWERIGATYQVVIACAICRTSLVVLSRN